MNWESRVLGLCLGLTLDGALLTSAGWEVKGSWGLLAAGAGTEQGVNRQSKHGPGPQTACRGLGRCQPHPTKKEEAALGFRVSGFIPLSSLALYHIPLIKPRNEVCVTAPKSIPGRDQPALPSASIQGPLTPETRGLSS